MNHEVRPERQGNGWDCLVNSGDQTSLGAR